MTRDVDVLVAGSGAAGLAAALSARDNGATSVLVVEAEGASAARPRRAVRRKRQLLPRPAATPSTPALVWLAGE